MLVRSRAYWCMARRRSRVSSAACRVSSSMVVRSRARSAAALSRRAATVAVCWACCEPSSASRCWICCCRVSLRSSGSGSGSGSGSVCVPVLWDAGAGAGATLAREGGAVFWFCGWWDMRRAADLLMSLWSLVIRALSLSLLSVLLDSVKYKRWAGTLLRLSSFGIFVGRTGDERREGVRWMDWWDGEIWLVI
ncbi:hypothetical protein F5X98DRAFT_359317 [Xylaria grammica]|nr:hypothetical protein F5X98DRAFT_359317 [Xylaria grammica]